MPTKPADDGIGRGVRFTVVCQIAFIVVLGLLASAAPKIFIPAFIGWGVLQWIALIPLCLVQRSKGYSLTVKGIIITGCIGFLLDAGCAMFFSGRIR
jgi:hypothetical protein